MLLLGGWKFVQRSYFLKGKKAGPLSLQTWQSETASALPERKYSNLFMIAKGNKILTKGKLKPVAFFPVIVVNC